MILVCKDNNERFPPVLNTDLKFAIFNVSYKEKSTNHTNAIWRWYRTVLFFYYKFSIPLHNQMNTLDNELNNEFQISGREMFEFNPDLVGEDDDEATEGVIERERDSDDEVKHRERGRAEWLQKSHFQMCVIVPTSGCLFNCFFVLNEINTWLLWCLIKKKYVMEFRMVLYEVNEL